MAVWRQLVKKITGHPRLCLLFFFLFCLQYALWFGWGNWIQIWFLRKEILQQNVVLLQKEHRNTSLLANVRSLEDTDELLEEKAREELGLVDPSQVYYDVYFKRPLPVVHKE